MLRSLAPRLAGLTAAALLVLAVAPAALAKEGVEVTLAAPIPADAPPGDTVTVFFTLSRITDTGTSPLRGSPAFLRLTGPTGATTEAAGVETGTPGTYRAAIVIPAGGAARAEFGIHGAAVDANGTATTSDIIWPYDGVLVAARPPAAVDPGTFRATVPKPATGDAQAPAPAASAPAPVVDGRLVAGSLLALVATFATAAILGRRRLRHSVA